MSVPQTWSRQAAKKHVSLKHIWGHDCGEAQILNVQISKIKVILNLTQCYSKLLMFMLICASDIYLKSDFR